MVGDLKITMREVALQKMTKKQRDKAEGLHQLDIMKKRTEANDEAVFDQIMRQQVAKEDAARKLAAKERARKQQAAEQSMKQQRAGEQQAARAREQSQCIQAAKMQPGGFSGMEERGMQAPSVGVSKEQAMVKKEDSGCCVMM